MHVLLIGAGYMASEYAKVLISLKIKFTVIGRSKQKAEIFEKELGIQVITGGVEAGFRKLKVHPTHAIVASSLDSLEINGLFLIEKGIKNILLEKPASLHYEGLNKINKVARAHGASCYIAYNRRFYSSVLKARQLIENEGGLKSFLFEFTEWSHVIGNLNKSSFHLNNWFIGNSTHVIDTAFFFGGKPKEMSSFVQSELSWHPKGSIYVGSGKTERGILFSYHANWNAPGSWKLELLTNESRYIFRPFEELHVQRIGSVAVEKVNINNSLDLQFKPGLYEQTRTFLFQDSLFDSLLKIEDGVHMMEIYESMNKQ